MIEKLDARTAVNADGNVVPIDDVAEFVEVPRHIEFNDRYYDDLIDEIEAAETHAQAITTLEQLKREAGPSVDLSVYREHLDKARIAFAKAGGMKGLETAKEKGIEPERLSKYPYPAVEVTRVEAMRRGREAFRLAYGTAELIAAGESTEEAEFQTTLAGNALFRDNKTPTGRAALRRIHAAKEK